CILGLFVGKQRGIFVTAWLYLKVMRQKLGITTGQLYATSCLCGVGFTMSLFIGSLAFGSDPHLINLCRLGVLTGSTLSIIYGLFLLRRTLPRHEAPLPLPG
ncbi:MAG: Na+/H+ antiporter NhaA, partial [Pseudomonadota bacterium]